MKELIFTVYLVIGRDGHRFVYAISEDDLDNKLLENETPVYYTNYFHDSLSGYIELLVDYLGFEETGELVCSIMKSGFYQGRKYFRDFKTKDQFYMELKIVLDQETVETLLFALTEKDIDEISTECLYFGIKPIRELNEELIFNYSFN